MYIFILSRPLQHNSKLATVQTMKNQYTPLFPLCAIGVITILCIAIVASYVRTANRENAVIIPGGVTYTGK